jgi:hypothetical protein
MAVVAAASSEERRTKERRLMAWLKADSPEGLCQTLSGLACIVPVLCGIYNESGHCAYRKIQCEQRNNLATDAAGLSSKEDVSGARNDILSILIPCDGKAWGNPFPASVQVCLTERKTKDSIHLLA